MAPTSSGLKNVQVTITLGTIVKALLVVGVFALIYLLRDLVLVVVMSVVIASAIEPLTRWFARYRVPRVPAVLIIYIITFAIFLGLVPMLVFPILNDLSDIAVTLPSKIGNLSFLNNSISSFTGSNLSKPIPLSDIILSLRNGLGGVPTGFVQTASFVFGGFFSFILIVVISFYLSVQSGGIESFLKMVTPVTREAYVIDLWRRAQRKIGWWMQGQLLLGLIMGILVFLGLTILQVDYALVLAFVAALFEVIPFFGPTLSAVPAVLLGFATSPTLGFMVIGLYIIMQQFENHLIYPLVVKKMVGVPTLAVILSLLVGGKLFGFLGIILAVPVATILMEIVNDWEKHKYLFQKANVA